MRVEQVDREAAAKVLRTFIQDPAYADMIERGEADFDPNVRLFEAHRTAAEQRGREQERSAVVAYLHAIAPTEQYIRDVAYLIADRIKDGEHLK